MRGTSEESIVLEQSGTLKATSPTLKARIAQNEGRYRATHAADGVWLLQRSEGGHEHSRLLMAGEIVSRATVMEVVSTIAQNQWRGELQITGPSGVRRLTIEGGALKAAGGGAASERLGEVMVASGTINVEQLDECLRSAGADKRIGEIAIEHGFVTQAQLFDALRMQTRRIFQNALLEESGYYALLQRPDDVDGALPALIAHMPIQQLLMESVQRLDEMALFRERIPNGHVRLARTPRASSLAIDVALQPLAALADGKHSLLDLARLLHTDEYEITKAACQLVQKGVIEILPESTFDEIEAVRVIGRFNQLLRRIYEAVARHGDSHAWHLAVEGFIAEGELAVFFASCLREQGTIDPQLAAEKLRQQDHPHALEALHQSLHDVAAFAMLSASTTLPRDAESTLSRLVSRKLSHLRRN